MKNHLAQINTITKILAYFPFLIFIDHGIKNSISSIISFLLFSKLLSRHCQNSKYWYAEMYLHLFAK